jgi:hypothetical protein
MRFIAGQPERESKACRDQSNNHQRGNRDAEELHVAPLQLWAGSHPRIVRARRTRRLKRQETARVDSAAFANFTDLATDPTLMTAPRPKRNE